MQGGGVIFFDLTQLVLRVVDSDSRRHRARRTCICATPGLRTIPGKCGSFLRCLGWFRLFQLV